MTQNGVLQVFLSFWSMWRLFEVHIHHLWPSRDHQRLLNDRGVWRIVLTLFPSVVKWMLVLRDESLKSRITFSATWSCEFIVLSMNSQNTCPHKTRVLNVRAIQSDVLYFQLDSKDQSEPDASSLRSDELLCPIFNVLIKGARGSRAMRKYCRLKVRWIVEWAFLFELVFPLIDNVEFIWAQRKTSILLLLLLLLLFTLLFLIY